MSEINNDKWKILSPTSDSRYVLLADFIRKRIKNGELVPGDRLPSFQSMRDEYGVAQGTIEKAHSLLEREGLISRHRRKGVFVNAETRFRSAKRESDGLLDHTVAILTLDEDGFHPGHTSEGWREKITLGAVETLKSEKLHVLSLDPGRTVKQGAEQLAASAPMGVVACDICDVITQHEFNWELARDYLTKIRKADIPVVVYGDAHELAEFDRVTSDQELGSYILTRWLIQQGRTRIAAVWYAPATQYWFPARRAGYERAMLESGLVPLETILIPPHSFETCTADGFDRASRYLAGSLAPYVLKPDGIDAVMTSSDGDVCVMASSIRRLGLTPNIDILFAGYDDYWMDIAEREFEDTGPAATINKNNRETGVELVRLLLNRIGGRVPAEPQRRMIQPNLVIVGSELNSADD